MESLTLEKTVKGKNQFSKDRPSYAQMYKYAAEQTDMFDPNEEGYGYETIKEAYRKAFPRTKRVEVEEVLEQMQMVRVLWSVCVSTLLVQVSVSTLQKKS